MNCENCNDEHDGTYGSGRFCSSKCARGFSTKRNRKQISKKVSKTLKGKFFGNRKGWNLSFEQRSKIGKLGALSRKKKKQIDFEKLSWDELVLKYSMKIMKKVILKEQKDKCNRCGLSEWQNIKLTLQVHHIDGDKKNNKRNNLECLCPNCHSITDNYGMKGRTIKPWNKGKTYKIKNH